PVGETGCVLAGELGREGVADADSLRNPGGDIDQVVGHGVDGRLDVVDPADGLHLALSEGEHWETLPRVGVGGESAAPVGEVERAAASSSYALSTAPGDGAAVETDAPAARLS